MRSDFPFRKAFIYPSILKLKPIQPIDFFTSKNHWVEVRKIISLIGNAPHFLNYQLTQQQPSNTNRNFFFKRKKELLLFDQRHSASSRLSSSLVNKKTKQQSDFFLTFSATKRNLNKVKQTNCIFSKKKKIFPITCFNEFGSSKIAGALTCLSKKKRHQ